MEVRYEHVHGGFAVFVGALKVAVLNTHHFQGLVRDGVPLLEQMPRSSWTIHFTSPLMHVEIVEAILKSLPAEA